LSNSKFFDKDQQNFQFFHRKRNKSLKIVKIPNFGQLRPSFIPNFYQNFPSFTSILSKYQFHFDQLWANITSILTNFDKRLNYWEGVTKHPPPPPPPPPPIATSLKTSDGGRHQKRGH
jgi:hypothetical protein